MKRLILTCFSLFTFFLGNSQIEWVFNQGSTGDDESTHVACDDQGFVYVTGTFEETVDFDPGNSTASATSMGQGDVFIEKFTPNGDLLWVRTLKSIAEVKSNGIAVDPWGFIYITGSFSGTVDFDPGAGITNLTSPNAYDAYILKIDNQANFLWARSFGGMSNCYPNSIFAAPNGGIFTTGSYSGTADFDPGPGIVEHTAVDFLDGFIHHLDKEGNLEWVRVMDDGINCNDITIDSGDNLYVTGQFIGTHDFDWGSSSSVLTSTGGRDVFLLKLSKTGDFIWAKSMHGDENDFGVGVEVGPNDMVYLTGQFSNEIDLDMGATDDWHYTNSVNVFGVTSIFLTKADTSGNFIWGYTFGTETSDYCHDIVVDFEGNAIISGSYNGTCDFDGGPGVFSLSSGGPSNIYYLKVADQDGSFIWAKRLDGACNYSRGEAVHVGPDGSIYGTGYFSDYLEFDASDGLPIIPSAGEKDVMVIKFSGSLLLDETASDSYLLAPNPNDGVFSVSFKEPLKFNWSIYNSSGQLVMKSAKTVKDNSLLIDLSSLPSNTYQLIIETPDAIQSIPVVKQ